MPRQMFIPIRKLIFTFFFNSSLFLLLIVGIQNNLNKSKVNLILDETVSLPIGFILGSSFITGSLVGSFITIDIKKKTRK